MRTVICAGCGKPFLTDYPQKLYHNHSCKMKAYRKRKFTEKLSQQKALRHP
jgi:hypothetical protein